MPVRFADSVGPRHRQLYYIIPGGIPPGIPPMPPGIPPPGGPLSLVPFDETTSSIRKSMLAASVADLLTCSFTLRGLITLSDNMSAIFPVLTWTPNHLLPGSACLDL